MYQIFKIHMKSSNNFKQIIGNENWAQASLLMLRFFKDLFTDEDVRVKIASPERMEEENEPENYTKIIQDSKNLLNTLNYQKSKLEHLNQEFSGRSKGSPNYRGLNGNLTSDKILLSQEIRKDVQGASFHTANKLLKNYSKFKNAFKK